jgi:hypothetical protein
VENTTTNLNYLCSIDTIEIKVYLLLYWMNWYIETVMFTLISHCVLEGGAREIQCKKNNVQLSEELVIALKTTG